MKRDTIVTHPEVPGFDIKVIALTVCGTRFYGVRQIPGTTQLPFDGKANIVRNLLTANAKEV